MFAKLANSWQLVKASARVLQADKELIVFPLISGAALIVVTATFILPLFFLGSGFSVPEEGAGVMGYVMLSCSTWSSTR